MSKRYQIQYGKLYVYNVVKETDKQFVYSEPDWRDSRVTREQRKSKAGTFPTLREALADKADSLDKSVAYLASDLDGERKNLAQYRDVLGRSDEKLEKAVDEILKLRR